jgi:hypothetical protein
MTDVELELARKLAAHPKWRFMRGMWALGVTDGVRDHCDHIAEDDREAARMSPSDYVPDLSDPATQGCLWAMLCESPKLFERTIGGKIACHTLGSVEEWTGSRGEALARALLAAWGES